MDTEMIKQMAESVNNVILATAKPYQERIKRLEVACRLAKTELLKITNDSYALAAIDQALKG